MLISKVNEVYLNLKVDEDLERELTDYFTFEVPGAKFMPHYRRKLWDGKIRLFSPHNGRIYVGLLPYIKEFCSRNSVEYIICLLYTSPSPRDLKLSRMPSSA